MLAIVMVPLVRSSTPCSHEKDYKPPSMLLSADGDASLGISSSLRKLEETAMEMRAVNEQQPVSAARHYASNTYICRPIVCFYSVCLTSSQIILLGTPAAGALVEAEMSVARGWLWASLLLSFVLLVALTANINGADSVSDVLSTQISPLQAQQTYSRGEGAAPTAAAGTQQAQDARRALGETDPGTSSGPDVRMPGTEVGSDPSRHSISRVALSGRPSSPMLTYRRLPAPMN